LREWNGTEQYGAKKTNIFQYTLVMKPYVCDCVKDYLKQKSMREHQFGMLAECYFNPTGLQNSKKGLSGVKDSYLKLLARAV
jgi:hypothetical protein